MRNSQLEPEGPKEVENAIKELGITPSLFCIFMLSGLITARVGVFSRMSGLDVSDKTQGYTIWWLTKHFLIKAATKGVKIPGLETEPGNCNGDSPCDSMLLSANAKLEQFENIFATEKKPLPELFELFFQVADDQPACEDADYAHVGDDRDADEDEFDYD